MQLNIVDHRLQDNGISQRIVNARHNMLSPLCRIGRVRCARGAAMCGRRRLCVHKNGSRVASEITGYFQGLPLTIFASPSMARDWREVSKALTQGTEEVQIVQSQFTHELTRVKGLLFINHN